MTTNIKIFPKQTKNWHISSEYVKTNTLYKHQRFITWNERKYKIIAHPNFLNGIFFNEEKQQWYGIK